MQRRPGRIAKSSSRSSKKVDAALPRTSTPEQPLVSVAHIAGAHGVRGALRLRPHGGKTTTIAPGRRVTVRGPGIDVMHTITRVTPHGRGQLLVEVDGLRDRTTAEALAGCDVSVPTTALPPLAAGEFYYHEMPGFRVETASGRTIGEITETLHSGTTDVWVVCTPAGERLIPVIRDVVASIDREARRVVITPIPGLLD